MTTVRILLFVLLMTLIINSPAISAQEATTAPDGGWPMVERCVGEPKKPPKGWSFKGTILITGYAGIHGVNAKWDTPRVVASASPYLFRSGYADGSAGLSPDNKWYATFDTEFIYSETFNHLEIIHAIVVYSTSNKDEVYRVPWKNSWLYMWGPRRMWWFDNSHLVYEQSENFTQKPGILFIVNPFDGTMERWTGKVDLAQFSGYPRATEIIYSDQYVSPDFTLTLKRTEAWGLYDVMSGSLVKTLDVDASPFSLWSPDSSKFITEIEVVGDDMRLNLGLFSREGEYVSKLYTVRKDTLNVRNASWSPDGSYFTFLMEYNPVQGEGIKRRVLIADMVNGKIYDTCLDVGRGLAWSPQSNQFALFTQGTQLTPVSILDLETWTLYTVAYHLSDGSDYIIGWRTD